MAGARAAAPPRGGAGPAAAGRFRTCATVTAGTPRGMARAARAALSVSDLVELRLDFLRPGEAHGALAALRPAELSRAVCTVRPAAEGGAFEGREGDRASLLAMAAGFCPRLVDVEYSALRRSGRLASRVRDAGAGLLVSWHDFGGTPAPAALRRRLAGMRRRSPLAKVVTTAAAPADAARVLSLYGGERRPGELVAFAMGEMGRVSRVLCLHLGSPFTYVSASRRPAAPGQFGAREMAGIIRSLGRGGRAGAPPPPPAG